MIDAPVSERFGLSWPGKAASREAADAPSRFQLVFRPDESVRPEGAEHLFVTGDCLDALKLLEPELVGRVKAVVIDPPYNTGQSFIYPDRFRDRSLAAADGRDHAAWLSMMFPRLALAHRLLRPDGALFVTIDDAECHHLRMLCDELFGEGNFVTSIAWQRKVSPANDARYFSSDHDWILVYARDKAAWRPNRLPMTSRQRRYYQNPDADPRGPWNSTTYTCNKTRSERPNLYYPIRNPHTGEDAWPSPAAVWAYSREVAERHALEGLLYWGRDGKSRRPRFKKHLSAARRVVPRTVWTYSEVGSTQSATQALRALLPDMKFETPKPPTLIRRILEIATDPAGGDIVLDCFAGSGTTAQAVLEANAADGGDRRFVLVQLPERTAYARYPTIADIARARVAEVIRRLGNKVGYRAYRVAS
ncbi:MAG: site-specific DNA-methyltransferase [Candidatus Sericytochromatia bacterium]|nr:site-specific DNA-methyltransferase [Candidatus Tanganyikabacteria bacterium]